MIKKICGFLLVALGTVLESIGWFGIGRTGGQLKAVDLQLQQELFESYTKEHENSLMMGGGLIAVGLILLVVGLILVGAKPKIQK